MRPVLVTAPSTVPVTLAEAKAFLRVDHSGDDALIGTLIASAVAHLDGWDGILGRCLEPQTWEIAYDRFPAAEIRIPMGPAASVVSVIYADPAGAPQTVAPADYVLDAGSVEGWVVPRAGFAWPATIGAVNAVKLRWVAGTGCPPALKELVLHLITRAYDSRGLIPIAAAAATIPQDMIAPFRRFL